MKFHVFGLEDAPNRLFALHGFMANGQSWETLCDELGDNWQIIAPDIAPSSLTDAHFDSLCDDIAQYLYALNEKVECPEGGCAIFNYPPPPIILGYSMGGRIALELMQRYPDVPISGLILESAGLGIDTDDERAQHEERAKEWAHIFQTQTPEQYVTWWESLPLFETQRFLPENVTQRQRALRCSIAPEVLVNLTLGIGAEQMHSARDNQELLCSLSSSGMLVAYIAGEHDAKYSAIARRLEAENVCVVRMFNAGHNAHLEAPAAVADFICQCEGVA